VISLRAALLLAVPSLLLHADPFPAPVSPERPLSDPVAGIAAGTQSDAVVVSNGGLALAAWSDDRRGVPQGYATRIDDAGRVLDPAGILLIERGEVHGVTWNGTHFVAVTRRDRLVPYTLVFVAPDGTVAGRRVLDVPVGYNFADASDPGAGVRLLFQSSGALAALTDGTGDVVALNVPLGAADHLLAAGSRGDEFLILYRSSSTRIDGSGRVLSSHAHQITTQVLNESAAVEGGPGGWVAVSKHQFGVQVQRLDDRGVALGAPEALLEPHPDNDPRALGDDPRIVRESGGYAVVWNAITGDERSSTYAARIPDAGAAGPVRVLREWDALATAVAFASAGGQRVAVTTVWQLRDATGANVVAQTVTADFEGGAPVPLALTPPSQSQVAVAAGHNGYLTAWREIGGDDLLHIFVRRIHPDGQPQGAPVEVAAANPSAFPGEPRIASNGSTYLVTWRSGDFVYGRRLVASTATWIDAAPFTIASGSAAVASNGTGFLAVSAGECPDLRNLCLYARRIAEAGEPLVDPVVTLAASDGFGVVSIASNGSDYLVAWQDGYIFCEITCNTPTAILAARLRPDATMIDPQPLVLTGKNARTMLTTPAVAWNGGRYLVAWERYGDVDGAYVTAEGAIGERTVLASGRPGASDLRLVAWRDQFVLFAREVASTPDHFATLAWTGVSFDAGEPLAGVAALPRTPIVSDRHEHYFYGTLDAASAGPAMLVVYDRTVEVTAGGVPRAFTRLFGGFGPRRRAVR
jgi:hypothetical protein